MKTMKRKLLMKILEKVTRIIQMKKLILISLVEMNNGITNPSTIVRNVRQVIKVGRVCCSTTAANMEVFVFPVLQV